MCTAYIALEKFSKAFNGTTGGTYSAQVFRPVMIQSKGRFVVRESNFLHLLFVFARDIITLNCTGDSFHCHVTKY